VNVTPQQVVISFDKLSINSIEVNSGVFIISYINDNGWSSHRKTNNGFGAVGDSTVCGCVSVDYDNDVIDSPIQDSDHFTITNPPIDPMNSVISFNEINVNGLENNSAISVGNMQQPGWSAHGKINAGVGGSTGILVSKHNSSGIFDNDYIDAPIKSNSQYVNTASDDNGAVTAD
jgi:hypothetical protein